jgi:hypothetical protein
MLPAIRLSEYFGVAFAMAFLLTIGEEFLAECAASLLLFATCDGRSDFSQLERISSLGVG